MNNFEDFLDQLCCFSGVDILCFAKDQFWDYREYVNFNPIRENEDFKKSLMLAADKQDMPLLILESHEVMFACIRQDVGKEKDAYFMIGPMSWKQKSKTELHYYYHDYGMKTGIENPIPVLDFTKMLELVVLATGILTETRYTPEQLIKGNHLDAKLEQILEEEQKKFLVDYNHLAHHTYDEERKVLNAVREGRTEDVAELSMIMDSKMGIMSKNEMLHWHKVVAISIALCTRAAIESGLSPTEAYKINDFYNQKCDKCKNIGELIDCRNIAVCDLTDHVRKLQKQRLKSNYVERCCDYIHKHYSEKIRLEDMAANIGLNSSYLSRIFSKEMGMTMQDYIVQERIEHAANMLLYSELEISQIGDYVNFPSQSYFGRMFKKYKHMTPGKYRSMYQPKEFKESGK